MPQQLHGQMPPAHRRPAPDQGGQIEVGGHVLAAELVGRDGDERVGGADVDVPDPGHDVAEAEREVEEEVEVVARLVTSTAPMAVTS